MKRILVGFLSISAICATLGANSVELTYDPHNFDPSEGDGVEITDTYNAISKYDFGHVQAESIEDGEDCKCIEIITKKLEKSEEKLNRETSQMLADAEVYLNDLKNNWNRNIAAEYAVSAEGIPLLKSMLVQETLRMYQLQKILAKRKGEFALKQKYLQLELENAKTLNTLLGSHFGDALDREFGHLNQ